MGCVHFGAKPIIKVKKASTVKATTKKCKVNFHLLYSENEITPLQGHPQNNAFYLKKHDKLIEVS